MIRSLQLGNTVGMGLKVGSSAIVAARPFSTSTSLNDKSKRLPSFADIKAVQLEKYIKDIRTFYFFYFACVVVTC